MTNADVIRQMTDDELYRFLGAFEIGDIDYSLTYCNWCGEDINCDTCFRRWLFGDANDYKGLLADKGINSGYAESKADTPKTEDYDFRDEQEYNDRWQTDCAWMYDSRRDYEYDKALDELERNFVEFEEFDDGEDETDDTDK